MNLLRATFASIHTRRLKKNIKGLLNLAQPGEFFCPIIKAHAYGHGSQIVAQTLNSYSVQNIGVALVEEALEVGSCFDKNIFILGPFDASGAQVILDKKFIPFVKSWHELEALEKAWQHYAEEPPLPVHIKFNTGMNRYGFSPKDAEPVAAKLSSHPRLELQGLCTHFYFAEDGHLPDGHTAQQWSVFLQILKKFSGFKFLSLHCLNSAALKIRTRMQNKTSIWGAKNTPQPQGLRPGLSVYGLDSPLHQWPEPNKKLSFLKPVLKLCTRVVEVRRVGKGAWVSYGGGWRAPKASVIAVLPVGYGDGVFWAREVFCGQRLCPVVGPICMDAMMVDVTSCAPPNHPQIQVGDKVEILGDNLPLDQVAVQTGLNPRVILTSLGARIPRILT